MLDWAALALAGLKLVLWFLDNQKTQQAMEVGRDEEIARHAAAILAKTAAAKRIMGEINALSPDQVDDLLHRLEPDGVREPVPTSPSKNS